MKFNSYSDSAGLCQDTDFWVGTDTTKYSLVHKARNATEWLKKAGLWIWEATGIWEFDDSNLTTLPVATTTLVDSQQDYELPTTIFKLDRVEVLDSNSNFQRLFPIDKSQIEDQSMTEFHETAGLPIYYDIVGNSLMLYPKPSSSNVTLTNGLKIYVARDVDPFVSTDTSKEPGFSEYFHRIISIGMALDYAIANGLQDKVVILKRVLYGDPNVRDDIGLKGELQKAYGTRDRDFKTRLNITPDNRI